MGGQNVVFDYQRQEEEVWVSADVGLLTKVFQNVISNCIRYARENIQVVLQTDGAQAVLTVQDDGGGVCIGSGYCGRGSHTRP